MPPFSKFLRPATSLLAVAPVIVALTGCSEYLDRTDTMTWQSGNAVQTDKVTQMVDPWPAVSANRDIAFDGAVMETAMTRYRTGRVITPKGISSDGSAANNAPPPPPPPGSTPIGPTVNAQSAPVK
ncbi:MAG: hypothetical protein WC670_16555 [Pseudolabrys sp.]|jgi:hypothetical protein